MRRAIAVLGGAVLALVVLTPSGWAGEQISGGNWDGSALEGGATTTTANAYALRGTFRHNPNRPIKVTVSTNPVGEGACATSRVTLPTANTPQSFEATLSIPCNGVYTIVAAAVTTENNAFFPPESASLDRRVAVSAPAPVVTGVTADGDGRSIEVRWDDMTAAAPDVSSYVVQRQLNNGGFVHLANVNVSRQSFVDNDLPDEGGDAAYQVLSVRPAPDGEKRSAASTAASASYPDAPSPTTTRGTGGDSSGGSDGSGDGGSTDGGTTGSGGSTGASGDGTAPGSAGGAPPTVGAPRVFSGTFLPPLLRPATQSITTPTTLDTGFADTLPYTEGAPERALPGDSLASITSDGDVGRGMVIPIATALVLAVWAVHLRMLARAARPLD